MSLDTALQWERRFGGFARMFPRLTAAELADALRNAGLTQVQLNLNALGLPTIPTAAELADIDLVEISNAFAERNLVLWGLSATYNMAHPDPAFRRAGTLAAVEYLNAVPHKIAVSATLCTGSREHESMWRAHPENRSKAAWRDFRAELDVLLEGTQSSGLILGVEPEPGNVVADTDAAVRLINELGADADRIGFVLDPANLVSTHPREQHLAILEDAFERLGDRAICIHIKDTVPWAETLDGRGVVDYSSVVALSRILPQAVPLIIQDATEAQVTEILVRLRAAVLVDSAL